MTRWDRLVLGLLLVGLWVVWDNLGHLREDLWTRRSMDEHLVEGAFTVALETTLHQRQTDATLATLATHTHPSPTPAPASPERRKWQVPRWGAR